MAALSPREVEGGRARPAEGENHRETGGAARPKPPEAPAPPRAAEGCAETETGRESGPIVQVRSPASEAFAEAAGNRVRSPCWPARLLGCALAGLAVWLAGAVREYGVEGWEFRQPGQQPLLSGDVLDYNCGSLLDRGGKDRRNTQIQHL